MSVSLDLIEKSLCTIVGKDRVITDPKELEKYGKDQSFVPPRPPWMAVKVKTKEEVQQIVKLANQFKIPLIPYSSGTTLQGAHIPSFGGVTVDLSLMNSIEWIDYDTRTACIEPGVTFKQLQDEAKKYGLRVMTAVEVPYYGSVLATYLERTPLYAWPKYGGFWELINFEWITPTGEAVAFGAMACPWIKKPVFGMGRAMGYSRILCAAQGTMGIVIKGIITLKTLHDTVQKVFFISFNDLEDAIRALEEIQLIELGVECFLANNLYLSAWLAESWPEEFEHMKEELSPWTIILVLRGWEEQVNVQEEDLKDLASKMGFKLENELKGTKNGEEKVLKELEYPQGALNLNRYKGAYNPIPAYAPLINIPKLDRFVREIARKHNYPEEDLGFFILPIERGQAIYYEPCVFRNPEDLEDTERARRLWYEIADGLLNLGAYYERPYGPLAEMTYTRAARYRSVLKRVKALLDPNNIMNPGKLTL